MTLLSLHKKPLSLQILYGILLVVIVSLACYAITPLTGYRVIALILLLNVSVTAMLFDIIPVLLSALISALVWDFFFIPPHFTFRVNTLEDSILLLMYFVIAMVNAALTYKIRQLETQTLAREEKANTIKLYNTLLNSLSHELRTPISAIVAATDNLQEPNQNLSPMDRQELTAEIAKAAFRLNQQVENLLSMSRLESGFLHPRKDWTDMQELVYDLVQRLEENQPTQKISIQISPGIPLFRIDKGMVEQVLHNLLMNAVQYTPPGTQIVLSATSHADMLEITVEDNGKGFPQDEIELVFNKFYRLKHTSTGGTGLGLSIVKGFTEAMGGSIRLENLPGEGARFTVLIPAETNYLKNLKNE